MLHRYFAASENYAHAVRLRLFDGDRLRHHHAQPPLCNIETKDAAGGPEQFGSPLTTHPAWFK